MKKKITHDEYLKLLGISKIVEEHDLAIESAHYAASKLLDLHTDDPGAVVRHKLGGPPMTVDETGSAGVACVWFNASGAPRRGRFDSRQLEHALAEVPDA